MSQKRFFSISGLAVAVHTPETEKIWQSWEDCKCSKSDMGRQAILKFAKHEGFEEEENDTNLKITEQAFNFLLNRYPPTPGIKSYVLRHAIIYYS